MRIVSQYIVSSLNAGPKAKVDVERIMQHNFNAKIMTNGLSDDKKSLLLKIKKLFFYLKSLYTKDLVVVQFPFTDYIKILNLSKNKIALIHDIEGLRIQNSVKLEKEIKMLKTFNFVIAHNDRMKNFLIEQGLSPKKIFVLEIFDYLCNTQENHNDFDINNIRIVYTGNLDKAPFLKQVKSEEMNFKMNVYGLHTGEFNNEKIIYCGSFLPDELPNKINGDLGLVWDGNADESDENIGFKNYTKYNNPHKLSCYLVTGLPVIVWDKSAIAEFVKKYNVGYVISNLNDINLLDFSDYNEKKTNVDIIRKKISNGEFTVRVFNSILNQYNGK